MGARGSEAAPSETIGKATMLGCHVALRPASPCRARLSYQRQPAPGDACTGRRPESTSRRATATRRRMSKEYLVPLGLTDPIGSLASFLERDQKASSSVHPLDHARSPVAAWDSSWCVH
jgi:hypothetical protein